jgi:anti-sigma regulatory factor (Ser/Thr protein kinase)
MPGVLPVLPRVDLAGAYHGTVPGAGDWFDAFATDSGLVGGVCGDVVGRGAAASAARAELGTALRVALLDGASLDDALAALDRHAARRAHTRGATAVVLLLDPATGLLQHARLGHPPALLRRASGRPELLHDAHGTALGLGGPRPAVHERRLEPGDAVLTCTKGLVRRAARTVDGALHHMLSRAAGAGPGAGDLCAAVTGLSRGWIDDDAAVLVVGLRAEPVRPLALDLPADAAELAGVRERLTEWLVALDVTAESVTAVPLVASELVSNAVEHAYAGRSPGRVRVRAELDGRGGLVLTVADDGRWREHAPGAGRRGGYGLAVARDLSARLDVQGDGTGTTVTAVCDLHLRAAVGADPPALAPAHDPLHITESAGDPPVVAVRGVIDAGAVDALHAAVLRAGAGGTRPVLLDLAGVTLLTSAGVRLLHEFARYPARPQLRAPAHSLAAHVLWITGLLPGPERPVLRAGLR